ncbi:uncharacterized mitochondrial protein-like protein [Tanacetum coccineum]
MMHKKFQMSSMGELTFFFGLQVKKKEDGIFISQDKYVTEILKKFSFTDVKTACTPMETQKPLLKDEDSEEVDVHLYRLMIGSLMYLTASRPYIMFVVCAYVRYQVNPKVSHLHAVKRIFRYLKGQPKLGLWYPKDSPFDLVAYTDSDYAGASLDRKSTTGGCQFLRCRLISWQCKKQIVVANSTTKAEYVAASSCCGQVLWIQNQLLDYGSVRRDLQLDDEEGMVCLPNATIFEELTRMGAKTTAWNEFSSTMASAIICLATNQKFNFSKYIFESMGKKLDNAGKFLMYPRRPKRKDTKIPQSSGPTTNVADEAVYKEKDDSLETPNDLDDIDKDVEITLVDETQGRYGDEDMFGVHDLDGDEVVVESEVTDKAGEKRNIVEEAVAMTDAVTNPVSAATITNVELTLAQTLAELKSARPKTKGVVMQEPSESTPIISLQLPSQVKGQGSKDKGKAKMIEPEKPLKKKYQIKFDEDEALRLQAEFDEEDRLAREKAQQAQEQQELTNEEKSTLFQQLLDKRRKFFTAKRAKEKRNRPPTRAQQRSIMCTYLKNMAGWKPKDLKNKSFANIQELFDKAMKRVNTFVDMDTELVKGSEVRAEGSETREESSSKRAGDELKQESTKKQKMDDDKETAELKSLMKIVLDEEEVAINAIPLATKPLSIMLRSFDIEDLETLCKLVKAKHGSTRPKEGYKRVLWSDLKTMFEPHVEDLVWRNLQGNKVLVWKLFDSRGVHFVRFQSLHVFMLVEKRYPLTPATITEMLNKKL